MKFKYLIFLNKYNNYINLDEGDLKESKPNVENVRQKKIKKDKEKLSSPTTLGSNNVKFQYNFYNN